MCELHKMQIELELCCLERLFPRAYPLWDTSVKDIMAALIKDGQKLCHNMLEIAISKIGKLEHDPTDGRDFVDYSDAKFATARLSSNETKYSANISSFHNKTGWLRIYVYERIQDKEYFFLVPPGAYKSVTDIEIPFHLITGNPKTKNSRWWSEYNVSTFDEMCAPVPSLTVKITFRTAPIFTIDKLTALKTQHAAVEEHFNNLFSFQ